MRPRVLPDAEAELLHAVLWYEEQREGLGEEFYNSVLAAFESIGKNPLRFPQYEGALNTRQLRRALVDRFPYVVIFEVRDELTLIIAVAHAGRQPDYWRNR